MNELQPAPTLGHDLRRMAPIWAVVVVTALIVCFSMKYIGTRQLQRAALGNRSACDYAEVYLASARREMSKQRDVAAHMRFESRELDKPSLGLLKGNAQLGKVREDLLRASSLCPSNSEPEWLLSVADWYLGNGCASLYHLGTAERRQNRLPEALIQYELALSQCPDDAESLLGKASCLRDLNRWPEALALVTSREAQLTQTASGKLIVGRILAQTTDTLKAERFLREGLAENPAEVAAVWDYVKVMKEQDKQHEGADYLISLGRGKTPTIAQVYHIASNQYRELGDLPNEERSLRDAIRLFPNSAVLCFDLSLNLYNQKKNSEAREMAKRAIDYDVNVFMQRVKETNVDPRV